FRTEVEDQIAYVSSPTDGTPLTPACAAFFGTFGGYQNFDEVRSQGAEFAGQMQVTDDLDVAVAYTFTDASITSRDRRLRDVPRHEGSFQVNWTGGAEGLTLGVDGRYRSNEDNFGGTSDSFFVARVRASYEVAGGGPEFFIRVENAFDEDYEESFGSGTPDRSVFGGVRVKY
ncbi:MAG: TonB-dependent receptor, partial [Pseudomonadota bacterium]